MGEPKNIKFAKPELILKEFGNSDWETQDKYPRFMADVNGDGKADIVGFGTDFVYVSFSRGDSFAQPEKLLEGAFTYSKGGWTSQEKYPRFLADVNGDGKADIVGFGEQGVFVSFTDTTTSGVQFKQPQLILTDFGVSSGWESQEKYPRFLADVDGDKKADIIGLGKEGMRVKFSKGDSFADEIFLEGQFSLPGWTSLNVQPRTTGDVDGNGKVDIIGFTTYGFFTMVSNGRGFDAAYLTNYNFGSSLWGDFNSKPRMLADVDGDGKADIVGFSSDGVYVSFTKSVPPEAFDLEACERFSPNIEVKCMQHVYNKALNRIDETKMTDEQKEQAKRELTSAYEPYQKLNSENNHQTDENKRNKETVFTGAVKTIEAERLTEVARIAKEAADKVEADRLAKEAANVEAERLAAEEEAAEIALFESMIGKTDTKPQPEDTHDTNQQANNEEATVQQSHHQAYYNNHNEL